MMNGESPKEKMLPIAFPLGAISLKEKRNWLLLRKKVDTIQTKDTNWDITVAQAAPATPRFST